MHLAATALCRLAESVAARERHEDEAFRRQRLDPAPLFVAVDYAALRHMMHVALVHNYLGDTKVPSDVRIAVEALKGKDPVAAVRKIYMAEHSRKFI